MSLFHFVLIVLLYLVCFPVAQGLHCDGLVGGVASQLQWTDGGTASSQVGQKLLSVLHGLLFSLTVWKGTGTNGLRRLVQLLHQNFKFKKLVSFFHCGGK